MSAQPSCSHRPPCPGCPRFGEAGLSPRTRARLVAWGEALGVAVPETVLGAAFGHRGRARLTVRGRSRNPKVGIFREGTHQLVDIPDCRVHHPLINDGVRALKRVVADTSITIYSESSHAGLLRAVQLVVERRSQSLQLTLVANDESAERGRPLAEALALRLGSRCQGVFLNLQPERSNAVLGASFEHVAGAEATCERLGGAQVFFPPGAFGQANLDLFERIVEDLHSEVPAGVRVLELFAGAGAIGLGLVERAASYRFNELGQGSLQGLAMGIAALPPPLQARVEVLPGSAASHARACRDADCVIVDPPRKGLDPEVVAALGEPGAGPETLLYLSCDLDALIRDELLLRERYRVARVVGYALFPFTEHVETLVKFVAR